MLNYWSELNIVHFFAELLIRGQYWRLFLLKYWSELNIEHFFLLNYWSGVNIEHFFCWNIYQRSILKTFWWIIFQSWILNNFLLKYWSGVKFWRNFAEILAVGQILKTFTDNYRKVVAEHLRNPPSLFHFRNSDMHLKCKYLYVYCWGGGKEEGLGELWAETAREEGHCRYRYSTQLYQI